ncbi:MAG: hypothetical protein AB7P69_24775, partial [Candidatus Binatia bacterium]
MPQNITVALKDQHEKEASPKFSEPPGVILPSQHFGAMRGYGHLTPTEKLMLAVLESAVHDFQQYRLATERRGKRLFREAQEWLLSREETEIFSCIAICHAVGIDPDYLRKGLLARPTEKRSGGKTEMEMTPANATSPLHSKEGGNDERRHVQYGTA